MRRLAFVLVLGLIGFGLASCHAPEQRYFKTLCDHVETRQVDPIGQPGVDPSAHLHDFFGSNFVEPTMTVAQLRAAGSTCDIEGDTASYWAPALMLDGVQQPATKIAAYYHGHPSEHVGQWPEGLRVVAGDASATSAQSTEITKWACDEHPPGYTAPNDCGTETVNLWVRFPECWDGTNLDSTNHRSHMAYPATEWGACPSSHPRRLMRLTMHVHYQTTGDPDLTLACGSQHCAHMDFLNAWDPAVMDELSTTCGNSENGDHPECQVA